MSPRHARLSPSMTGQLPLHRTVVDAVTELPKLLGLHATLGPSHPVASLLLSWVTLIALKRPPPYPPPYSFAIHAPKESQ